jgi:uncharacterized RDD family membrane protein YckC
MIPSVQPAAVWKRVLATVLDLLTAFFGFGMLVATLTGGTTDRGFAQDGWPALLVFALIGLYFYLGRRRFGGTLWDRVFGIGRPQPH